MTRPFLRRWLLPLIVLLALATLLENRALAAPAAILERGNGPEPDSLDPQRAQGLSAHQIIRDLFEGLVRDDADGVLVPAAAERYAISADGLVYTFELRPGGRFADGTPVTAADFVYSFERAVDPRTTAPYAAVFAPILGAEQRLAGQRDVAFGVAALEPLKLEIRLTAPRSDFLRRLALPVAMPLQRAAIDTHGSGFTRAGRLHGNGAYRLAEWTPQSSLLLERNPHYRNAAHVAIGQVRYHVTEDASAELKRFAAGELHLTESLPPAQAERLRGQYPHELVIAPAYASFFLGYNLRHPLLDDSKALREALSLAIDRDILVRHITGNGEPAAYEIVPKLAVVGSDLSERPSAVAVVGSDLSERPSAVAVVGSDLSERPSSQGNSVWTSPDPQKPSPDPEKPSPDPHSSPRLAWADWTPERRHERARDLYAQAGYGPQRPAKLELRYNTSLVNRRLALAIGYMWKEVLGVDTRLRNEEWKVFVQNRRAGVVTQVFRAGWFADYADALNFLEPFTSGHALNASGFADPAFDNDLARAARTLGPERMSALAQAEQRLLDAHALIPLYHYTAKHLVSRAVCGYRAHPLDHHPSEYLRFCEMPDR